MPAYRHRLPQLEAEVFLTDGGIETTLIFDDGFDLPDFAAFPLLETDGGRAALRRYFDAYLSVAVRDGVGIVLETPTWRSNPDWASRLGYNAEKLEGINRAAVRFLLEMRSHAETPDTPIVISGCIGPRSDGYQPSDLMTADEARAYHGMQVRTFADSEADLVTAITMTNMGEAIGVARAAQAAGIPSVISFTVETDGTLPTGPSLREAIEAVDDATDGAPAYYMVNCAHPSHFRDVFADGGAWAERVRGIRANASRLSHAELDEAEELDRGNPIELADDYLALRAALPGLTVLGGCCGTSHHHIEAISAACIAA
jgi:S-methylmethionine-dependent homocysteine/selenocysteine methylase